MHVCVCVCVCVCGGGGGKCTCLCMCFLLSFLSFPRRRLVVFSLSIRLTINGWTSLEHRFYFEAISTFTIKYDYMAHWFLLMIDLFKEFDIDDHDDDNLVLMMIIIIYFFIIWPWQKSLNSFSYVNGILHSEKLTSVTSIMKYWSF